MKILISDTHFGIRQNSITWLNSQMNFFYNQLIPFIKQQKESVRLIHLGDVFDSRSSINPMVANRVKQLFEDLCKLCTDGVLVIGGNHDYYSPNENALNDNSIDIVLGELPYYCPNFKLITKDFYIDGDELFVPWFRYFDRENLEKKLKNIKTIYIHNDLINIDPTYIDLFKNKTVYSGHIHIPSRNNNLITLGSTFALTFTDCNSERGFYVLQNDRLNFYPNQESIRFWRLYNGEIFTKHNINNSDYVELYIDQDKLSKTDYIERIKQLSKQINNVIIIPHAIEEVNEMSTDFTQYDITDICKKKIPNNLIQKFNQIINEET